MLKKVLVTFLFLTAMATKAVAGEYFTLVGFWEDGTSCNMATDSKPIYESTVEGMRDNFESRTGIRVTSYEKFKDGVLFHTKYRTYVLWYKKIDCLDPKYDPLAKSITEGNDKSTHPSYNENATSQNNKSNSKGSSGVVPSPSFDCSKAASDAEKLICSDAELAVLDVDLGRLYKQAKGSGVNSAAFKNENIREWKRRESECHTKICLIKWYSERKQQLQKWNAIGQ